MTKQYSSQTETKTNGVTLVIRLLFATFLFAAPFLVPSAYADADLAITKSVSNASPVEGESIIYTLTLTNNGTQNAAQLVVTDQLPAGVTYVSDDSGGDYDSATGLWTTNPLQSGSSRSLNITVTVDAGTAGSTITNTATITNSNRVDPNLANNADTANFTVTGAELAISKSVDDATPAEGDTVVYTLTLTNNGGRDATQNQVTDLLPAGVTYVSDDGGGSYNNVTGIWAPAALNIGSSATLNITATVDAGTTGNTISNTATISSVVPADPDTTNNTSTAPLTVSGADLAIVKTVDNGLPNEGDTIIYTLTLTNNGPKNAALLQVTDLLPAGVSYVSDDGAGSYDDVTGFWSPSPLNSGASAVLNITATVDANTAGSTITNTASITNSNRVDPDNTNDTSSVDINVVEASLSIIKSALTTSDPLNGTTSPFNIPGATILYNIQVTNTGLGTADNDSVFISDQIPANTQLFVGDLGAGSGPVVFIQGATTSGLTPIVFGGLGDAGDDIDFSNDNGATWTYTPVPDANGYDANVTNLRVNPKGTFAASDGVNNPSFVLRFQVVVE